MSPPIRDFLANLLRLKEPLQRVSKIVEFLEKNPPEEAESLLAALLEPSERLPQSQLRLNLDILIHRKELLGIDYGAMSALYEVAKAKEHSFVLPFLGNRMAQDPAQVDETIPELYAKELSLWTLGEKKQLARCATRKQIEVLAFDSDPAVIREWLKNPRVTEPDVVKLSARRRLPASILDVLLASERWMSSHRIRKSLVLNPCVPQEIRHQLMRHLAN